MRLADGIRLASAKLRAHRVRTGIVTFIVSLLFAGIVLALAIAAGVASSLHAFGEEGLGSRYIVKATPIVDMQVAYGSSNKDVIDKLTDEASRLKTAKKAEAKRLGIDYDANSDTNLPIIEYDTGGGNKMKAPNASSQFASDIITNYLNSTPHVSYEDFTKAADASHAKATYKSTVSGMMNGYKNGQSSVTAVVDGEEVQQSTQQNGPPAGVSVLAQGNWQFFDSELMEPFVLPGQSLAVGKDGSIPVIAPVSAAETFLKMNTVASTASPEEQLTHLSTLRSQIAGKTAQLCYRNAASAELFSTAKSQADEMQRNKNKAGYVAPSLQYALPADVCGAVTIKKDTRSAEEKKQAANQISFKKQFENYEEPTQGIITVRFVGLVPDQTYSMGFSVKDILKSMLQSGLGDGWFSPISAVPSNSLAAKVAKSYDASSVAGRAYYAEFATYADAKAFTKATTCSAKLSMKEMMSYSSNVPDPRVTKCYAAHQYFDVMPFGNNASAIADLKASVWKVMRVVTPVVLLIAALVLMGIVGKIIADSRRETAVFRALGATRSSIVQVYLTYGLFIAAIITVISGVIGNAVAVVLSNHFAPSLSVSAVLAYNSQDLHKQFVLFGVDLTYMLIIFGLILVATLLSTVIPLLTNIRRNPIRDMRDE